MKTDTIDPAEVAELPQLKSETRKLPVRLTDEEFVTFAEDEARRFIELTELNDAEKERRSDFNSDHKARQTGHANVARIVHERAEKRDVAVVVFGDVEGNSRITVRTDTYEVLDRSALSAAETQRLQQGDMFTGEETDAPAVIEGWELGEPPVEGAIAAYYMHSDDVSLGWYDGEDLVDHPDAEIAWPFADDVVLADGAPLEALGLVNVEDLGPEPMPADQSDGSGTERTL